ncbi:Transcription termination factor 3, mitochondrial [Armadillidium nasatum]|uniref:Transcription termination factor 3, mitochondrial n=1 Tax=Armadillidium nasatum TaxID=96803 RepID=A0A5N5TEF6_9CRUS|nr:Transcription termination factor 3, mitochondrial [Armadillidium nasatum]
MEHSVFKFACNISSQVLKSYSFISRHVSISPLIIDYNYLCVKKKKPCFFSQSYFHTSTNYFCKPNELISSKVVGNHVSETESHLDIKENVEKKPIISVKKNVLQPADTTNINFIAPDIKPTFNLAAYADRSVVLKHLIQLGVEIGRWDEKKEICANILSKDFENDIKPYIFFLHEHGVPTEQLGNWITKNPYIFEQSLENIQIRINYLESRKFKNENITFIFKQSS